MTEPSVGVSSLLRQRKKVLFPEPEGPITTTFSPLLITVSMPLNTSFFPKAFLSPLTSITLLEPPFQLSYKCGQPDHYHKIDDGDRKQRQERLICNASDDISALGQELRAIKKKYGSPRRTEIIAQEEISAPDPSLLIDDYPVKLLLTKHGFFKKLAATGSRGEDQKYKEGDGELQTVDANNTDSLLVFTNKLRMYAAKISTFDLIRPSVIGELLRSTLKMEKGEKPTAICPVNRETGSVVLAFSDGTALRCPSEDFPTDQRRIKLFAMQSGLAHPLAALPEKTGENSEIWFRTEDDKVVCINTRLIERTPLLTAIPVQAVILKKGIKLVSVTSSCPSDITPSDKLKKSRIPALPVAPDAI